MSLSRILSGIALIVVIGGSSLTTLIFFAWRTATPDTPPEYLDLYARYATASFLVLFVSMAAGIYFLATGFFPRLKLPPPHWITNNSSISAKHTSRHVLTDCPKMDDDPDDMMPMADIEIRSLMERQRKAIDKEKDARPSTLSD